MGVCHCCYSQSHISSFKGSYNGIANLILQLSSLKLVKCRCNKDIRKYFFSHRVVSKWNLLDNDSVILSVRNFVTVSAPIWKSFPAAFRSSAPSLYFHTLPNGASVPALVDGITGVCHRCYSESHISSFKGSYNGIADLILQLSSSKALFKHRCWTGPISGNLQYSGRSPVSVKYRYFKNKSIISFFSLLTNVRH